MSDFTPEDVQRIERLIEDQWTLAEYVSNINKPLTDNEHGRNVQALSALLTAYQRVTQDNLDALQALGMAAQDYNKLKADLARVTQERDEARRQEAQWRGLVDKAELFGWDR